jgi:hypothetical protein
MSLFVCDKCGCIDNTATGYYWTKNRTDMFSDKSLIGKGFCSECAPTHYSDGSKTEYGKWHNRFPKRKWNGKIKVVNRCEKCLKPIDNFDPIISLCNECKKILNIKE